MSSPTPLHAGKSGAIRSSRALTQIAVLVMSRDPKIREGWARHFERLGARVIRCAGPESTTCALELRSRCPLHEDADAAFYDAASVSAALSLDLLTHPRTVPITFARDRRTPEGEHEPEPVLTDPRALLSEQPQR